MATPRIEVDITSAERLPGRMAAVRDAFVHEVGRSFLRGAQAESNWPDGVKREEFPLTTGASRRGFFITFEGGDAYLRNREEYAVYVERGTRRRDGGKFISKWWAEHKSSVQRAAMRFALTATRRRR